MLLQEGAAPPHSIPVNTIDLSHTIPARVLSFILFPVGKNTFPRQKKILPNCFAVLSTHTRTGLFFAILFIMTTCSELKNIIFHTAIIGGGAGGLMCAGSFSQPKILIERNAQPGAKVSVSGGGNCNFSNRFVSAADYLSQNKHFCKNALAAFKPQDFLRLLDESHIPWEERAHGRLFAFSAPEIVRMLVRRAKQEATRFLTHTLALDIRQENGLFILDTSAGPVRAQRVVLACGGLSFPALGASQFGFKMAAKFGLPLVEPRPALVGLSFPKELRERFAKLAGNSLKAVVSCGKYAFEDQLLFTHEGISGPAVLSGSLYWTPDQPVTINFLPQDDALSLLHNQKNTAKTFSAALHGKLSPKIAKALLGPLDGDLSNASRQHLQAAANRLNRFSFVPQGTAGYTRAEVTAGGVDTRAINPSTFEAKQVPGLYIIGELLDVTGRLGGFNLHWAWASGFAAAKALEKQF